MGIFDLRRVVLVDGVKILLSEEKELFLINARAAVAGEGGVFFALMLNLIF